MCAAEEPLNDCGRPALGPIVSRRGRRSHGIVRRFPERRAGWRALAVAGLLLLAACGRATPIGDVNGDPRRWADKPVTVAGTVRDTTNLLLVRWFVLADASGEIAVVTERPLPRKGDRLEVTGTPREAYSLGDTTRLVLVEAPPAR